MKRIFTNEFIATIVIILFLSSCMKNPDFIPVDNPGSGNYTDSSDQNINAAKYQAILDKYVEKGLPGLVMLVHKEGEGLWIGASGYACIEDKTPMTKNHIVYSASIGKTYCAVAVMKLADQGLINLDDQINMYLSADVCDKIPNGNSATIKQLLGHTAGIPNFETGTDFIADVLNDPYAITTEDLIEYEYNKKSLFSAGNGYKYSSTGYELLAMIINVATGEHHSKFYTSEIFQPLGLAHTYYKNEPAFPQPDGLVNCYFDRTGDGNIENVSDVNNYLTSIFTGSDGIMASVYDYYSFLKALVEGNVVSQEALHEMTQWRDTYSWTTNKYGLGLQRRETRYGYVMGHDGDAMGAGTDMFYFPERNTYVVTATNLGTFLDTDLTELYNDKFHEELLDVLFE
jgi:D-alanyl-D-alanine carboxypeptidase